MSSTRDIKKRIRSVKNTAQITKAMEVVSATKMRRSQEFALKARPYAVASLEMLKNLLARTPENLMPELLKARLVKKSALLMVTSDKGLAGAFNANVLRKADGWLDPSKISRGGTDPTPDRRQAVIAVGKKAKEHFERRGVEVYKSFTGFGDYSTLEETLPIADLILQGFLNGEWDEVEAVYMKFRTTLIQEVVVKKILPATREGIEEAVAGILPERGRYAESKIKNEDAQQYSDFGNPSDFRNQSIDHPIHESRSRYSYEYKFEPSPAEILNALIPQLLRMHIHHIILESNASEHSARMVAMKNASDNARELIDDLTLMYNKARQAGITRELVEITAGREALEH